MVVRARAASCILPATNRSTHRSFLAFRSLSQKQSWRETLIFHNSTTNIDGRRRYPRKAIPHSIFTSLEKMQGSIVTLLILILSTIGIECISPSSSSVHHDKLEGGDGHEVVAGSLHHSTMPSIVVRRHNHVRVVGEEVASMVNSPRDLGLGNGKPNPPSQEPNLESGMCQTQHLHCH